MIENTANIPPELLEPYKPTAFEPEMRALWDTGDYANPDTCAAIGAVDESLPPFSMMLPPPNVTGSLHTGHALTCTIEDIMTRHARMQGRRTLWLPGTDHAAIATQSKVEKIIEKEGLRRADMGRTAFLERVHEFARNSHDTIVSQVRAMGASVDWSREAYTLDDARSLAVRTAFKTMYDDGIIIRRDRVVNWDPKGQTTISDDELVYEDRKSVLYTFKYSADFPIAISTTRPETKIGDCAVAVHPSDERYKQYIGQTFLVRFCDTDLEIKIIADIAVDPEFGTGALGVTPAHSSIDWNMAQTHDLPVIPVINEYAKIRNDARIPEYLHGKKVTDARETIVQWIRDNNLMISEAEVDQSVATAERSGAVIEPLPKLQWFIDVNKSFTMKHSNITGISAGDSVTLKDLMMAVVRTNQIEFLPTRFAESYTKWIENLRPWCISRQIWFGHRIPVWTRGEEEYCGVDAPAGDGWEQDPDSLDTWFSSGLWTFSTLGWPDANAVDFKTFHPTSVIETGYDILPFWVARMILMSTYLLGEIPFKTVYLHGMVLTADGKKMSKSLGNAAKDPLELIETYGADALRMGIIVANGPGQNIKLLEDKIKTYSKFSNKLWNITRFVLEQTNSDPLYSISDLSESDQEIWAEFESAKTQITNEMNSYQYHLASEKLYHYVWHTYADTIIEDVKKRIQTGATDAVSGKILLQHILIQNLKMLHPFMPHITEKIWQLLPTEWKANSATSLMICSWPR
jgi:valyl-tRNA synthetase